MNRFALISLAVAFFATSATAKDDHLWPASPAESLAASHDNYPTIVTTVFREAFQPNVRIRVLQSSPMVASVDMTFLKEVSGRYRVVYLHTPVHLLAYSTADWMKGLRPDNLRPRDYRNVKLQRCEIELAPQLAKDVIEAWKRVLLETRYEERRPIWMDGGQTRYSMRSGDQELVGESIGPEANTKPDQLNDIAYTMQELCSTKKMSLVQDLTREVHALLARF